MAGDKRNDNTTGRGGKTGVATVRVVNGRPISSGKCKRELLAAHYRGLVGRLGRKTRDCIKKKERIRRA